MQVLIIFFPRESHRYGKSKFCKHICIRIQFPSVFYRKVFLKKAFFNKDQGNDGIKH